MTHLTAETRLAKAPPTPLGRVVDWPIRDRLLQAQNASVVDAEVKTPTLQQRGAVQRGIRTQRQVVRDEVEGTKANNTPRTSPLPEDDEETICIIGSIDASPTVGAYCCGYVTDNTYRVGNRGA